MKDKPETITMRIEELKMILDKDFDDPLTTVDISTFNELKVEEIPEYYAIHLGRPKTIKQ